MLFCSSLGYLVEYLNIILFFKVSERLSKESNVATIYSSDLNRALKTVETIASRYWLKVCYLSIKITQLYLSLGITKRAILGLEFDEMN